MQICRYYVPRQGVRLGAIASSKVYDLTSLGKAEFRDLAPFLSFSCGREHALEGLVCQAMQHLKAVYTIGELKRPPSARWAHLMKPLDQREVWAAGVTYHRSKEARERESGGSGFYDQVYEAERPELFFKATASRAVGPYDSVLIRGDSNWTAPEPELVVFLNPELRVVGYSVGNDVTARDIEGENPPTCRKPRYMSDVVL